IGTSQNANVTATLGSSSQMTLVSLVGMPVITSATTASTVLGGAFSYQIAASNAPTSYGAAGLPTGLSINTATGLISGTPTTTGVSTVTINAANAAGTAQATLTLTVFAGTSVSFVQSAANEATSSLGVSATFPRNTSAGDLILVAFDVSGTAASTLSD